MLRTAYSLGVTYLTLSNHPSESLLQVTVGLFGKIRYNRRPQSGNNLVQGNQLVHRVERLREIAN